jgi:hypothetical protein
MTLVPTIVLINSKSDELLIEPNNRVTMYHMIFGKQPKEASLGFIDLMRIW